MNIDPTDGPTRTLLWTVTSEYAPLAGVLVARAALDEVADG